MAYAFRGAGALDYFPCQYAGSRLTFRGPRRDTGKDYIAVIGGTETYGRFVPTPYPDLLQEWLGLPVINLGCPNAGAEVFTLDPGVIATANRARAVIVQVLGAQNLSNRFYAVHPRRNDRFIGATPALRSLYRQIDFTEFSFTCHLLQALQRAGRDRFELVARELREVWVERMESLLATVAVPVILVWIGDQPPPARKTRADLIPQPMLVDADMIAAIRRRTAGYAEVVLSAHARAEGVSGMSFAPLEAPLAREMPGPAAHREVASGLAPVLVTLI
jgi:Domain of unknown function (DUF6473)